MFLETASKAGCRSKKWQCVVQCLTTAKAYPNHVPTARAYLLATGFLLACKGNATASLIFRTSGLRLQMTYSPLLKDCWRRERIGIAYAARSRVADRENIPEDLYRRVWHQLVSLYNTIASIIRTSLAAASSNKSSMQSFEEDVSRRAHTGCGMLRGPKMYVLSR